MKHILLKKDYPTKTNKQTYKQTKTNEQTKVKNKHSDIQAYKKQQYENKNNCKSRSKYLAENQDNIGQF